MDMLREKCEVSTNNREDNFVGLRFSEGNIKIIFPSGFTLSDNDKDIRKDIFLLLSVFAHYDKYIQNSFFSGSARAKDNLGILAVYQRIILRFLSFGYYTEKENVYAQAKRGKIAWSRTIKHIRPVIDASKHLAYLEFIIQKSTLNKDSILTHIHKYCVHKSFEYIGWLYTGYMPQKDLLPFNKPLYERTLVEKLRNTFNDDLSELLRDMLAIVRDSADNPYGKHINADVGVTRFEYVWEKMIDIIYGISENEKKKYFPTAQWKLIDGKDKYTSPLEPDTVLLTDNKVYIIDAKYYQYGISGQAKDLPGISSINKQITYGEYAAAKDNKPTFNVFLMPFAKDKNLESYRYIGTATSDWKNNEKTYEKVYGVLVDTKDLMQHYAYGDFSEKNNLIRVLDEIVKFK